MSENSQSIKFKIEGMTCASCAFHARRALQAVDGVQTVSIDSWHQGNAEIESDANSITAEQIKEVLAEVGYTAVL